MICTIIWVMPFLVGFPQWKNQKPKPTPNPFWDNARKGSSSKKLCLFTAGSYGFTGASKGLKAALWGGQD
jgi:hypothetical protein